MDLRVILSSAAFPRECCELAGHIECGSGQTSSGCDPASGSTRAANLRPVIRHVHSRGRAGCPGRRGFLQQSHEDAADADHYLPSMHALAAALFSGPIQLLVTLAAGKGTRMASFD